MKFYVVAFCALLSLGVGACTNNTGAPLAQMTFDHVKPFPVYVASYEPENIYASGMKMLPEGFVSDPSKLIYDYLQNRFEAAGHQGKLKIQIMDVSVQHAVVDSENKVGALIGLAKKDHYTVKAYIDVTGLGVGTYDEQKRSLVVSRNIFIADHLSLVERERMEMQALDNMVDDLDLTLRKILKDQFKILR